MNICPEDCNTDIFLNIMNERGVAVFGSVDGSSSLIEDDNNILVIHDEELADRIN